MKKNKKRILFPFSKKGFTLLEIMAVIVLLAIVSLITVPIVMRAIQEAKKKAFLMTAHGIVKSASLSFAENEERYKNYYLEHESITFKFSKSEGKEGESVDTIGGSKIRLAFNGTSPIGGEVLLHRNGSVEIVNLTDGTYYVNKDVDTEPILTEESKTLTRDELQKELTDLKKRVENLENNKNIDILSKTYPVGSIYISTSSTNPSTLFGGTWERFGEGKTLVGQDTENANFDTVSKIGGSTSHSHTGTIGNTTLTVNQIPSHSHSIPSLSGTTNKTGAHNHSSATTGYTFMIAKPEMGSGIGFSATSSGSLWKNADFSSSIYTTTAGDHTHTVTTNASTTLNAGNGSAHTHTLTLQDASSLPPYIVVYFFKRVS